MPWNDQGGRGGPWGGDRGNNGGNDRENPWSRRKPKSDEGLDDVIETVQRRLKGIFSGGGGGNLKSGGGLGLVALIATGAIVVWLGSGFYRVQEGDLGVVLRFGEMVRTAPPGLRYHLPAPIESVIVQKVSAVNTIDSSSKGDKNGDGEQSLVLTGDENVVHANYTVLWKIKEVSDYLFTAVQPEVTIRAAAESVIREVLGQTKATDALTKERDAAGVKAQELLQKLLDNYKMGIQVVNFQLQNVAPPKQVVDAFNDVQASLVDAGRSVNEAESYRNDIIPRARGQATQIEREAEAYAERVVAEAQGDATRFEQILVSFKQNKDVTTKKIYFETMQQILPKVSKMLMDGKAAKNILPYLPLSGSVVKKESTEEKK
jgi:membrane protease subunit HflK